MTLSKKQLEQEIEQAERILIQYREKIANGSTECCLCSLEFGQFCEVECLLRLYNDYYENQQLSMKSKLKRQKTKLERKLSQIYQIQYKQYNDFIEIENIESNIELLTKQIESTN